MLVHEGNSLSPYAGMGRTLSGDTLGYLRKRKENFRSLFVSDRMRGLLDDYDNSAQRLDMDMLNDEIRIARRRDAHSYDDGRVTYMKDIVDIQHASPTMRRLIMADSTIRGYAAEGRIEGWSTVYRDPDRGKMGYQHRDFRRLNDGLYEKDDDGVTRSRIYHESDSPNKLSLAEKLDAKKTIAFVKRMIAQGDCEDPTSINGGHF